MKRINITRRSFLLGGAATIISAGMAASLSSCNTKKLGDSSGTGKIIASCAYQDTQISPIANTNALGRACLWHICEGLYNIDYRTYKIYNGLAALSPTKINDYTYDVMLRDDAVFSNGQNVTVNDVVYSFKRNMTDEIFSSILGFIKDVTIKDKKTVTFSLNYPFENLIEQRLACVYIFPANMSDDELKIAPIGSGPWKLDSFDGSNGGVVEFSPNEFYSGKFPTSSSGMEWNVLLDDTSRINTITDQSSLAIEAVPELSIDQLSACGATTEFAQGFGCAFLMFNCLKEPFNDYRVRQAFHYAIDVDKLIENQLAGHALAASSFLPKNHENYHRAKDDYKYDPDKAKSLLSQAGISNLNCRLLVNNNWVKNLAAEIQNDLSDVGINIELDVKSIPWNNISQENEIPDFEVILTPGDPAAIGNDVDLLMSFWYGDNIWMNSRSCWKKSSPDNWSKLNTFLQRARESASSQTQQSYWNQCFDIIAEQCPILPIFHRELGSAYLSNQLINFKAIPTTGLYFLGSSVKD